MPPVAVLISCLDTVKSNQQRESLLFFLNIMVERSVKAMGRFVFFSTVFNLRHMEASHLLWSLHSQPWSCCVIIKKVIIRDKNKWPLTSLWQNTFPDKSSSIRLGHFLSTFYMKYKAINLGILWYSWLTIGCCLSEFFFFFLSLKACTFTRKTWCALGACVGLIYKYYCYIVAKITEGGIPFAQTSYT